MCWQSEPAKEKIQDNLFIWDAVSHVLQISADIIHVGVAEEDPCKVFLADGGQASGVGEELDLKHLCLQVVHEPAEEEEMPHTHQHRSKTWHNHQQNHKRLFQRGMQMPMLL